MGTTDSRPLFLYLVNAKSLLLPGKAMRNARFALATNEKRISNQTANKPGE